MLFKIGVKRQVVQPTRWVHPRMGKRENQEAESRLFIKREHCKYKQRDANYGWNIDRLGEGGGKGEQKAMSPS